jgi:acetyl-CoA carboxylase carboxyltransferase component
VQVANGAIDVLVHDETEAVSVAKEYLFYFQGRVTGRSCPDQRMLRHIVPENRLRSYDMRELIRTLADDDSVLELRHDYGPDPCRGAPPGRHRE